MRTRGNWWWWSLGALTSGCAFQGQMREAERAVDAGDWKAAAYAYQEACSLRPNHELACGRAKEIGRRASENSIDEAKDACAAKKFDDCLRALKPARDLTPDDPRVAELLDRVGRLRIDQCNVERANDVNTAFEAVRCVQEPRERIGTDAYAQAVAAVETSAASAFIREMSRHKESKGAQWAYASVAQCLEANANRAVLVRDLGHAFLDRSEVHLRTTFAVKGKKTLPESFAGLCEQAAAEYEGVTCAPATKPQPELALTFTASLAEPRHTVENETKSVRYVERIEQKENPEYAAAVATRRDAMAAVTSFEAEYAADKLACEQATAAWRATSCEGCAEQAARDAACAKASSSQAIYDRRVAEVEAAKQRVANTPTMIEVPVYVNHTYVLKHHTWAVDWQVASPGAPLRTGTFTRTDDEQRGFPPGEIPDDALRTPEPVVYDRALVEVVSGELRSRLGNELSTLAAKRREGCATGAIRWDPAWIECKVEADLWDPSMVVSTRAFTEGVRCQPSR